MKRHRQTPRIGWLRVARLGLMVLVCSGWAVSQYAARAEPAAKRPAATRPAGSFTIPAWAFDRGNARTFTSSWADAAPMVAYGGVKPVVIEYDIDLPVPAAYTISVNYAAQTARPVELYLDEMHLGQACRTATGSWKTSKAKWEEARRLWINPGKHTFKLKRDGAFPHVVSLRFDSSLALPEGWKPLRPKARKLDSPPPVVADLSGDPTDVNPEALRMAIEDLVATFGARYPLGPKYLKRLDVLVGQLAGLQGRAARGDGAVKGPLSKGCG